MPALSPLLWKLIGGAVAALALFLLIQDRNHWKKVAGDRNVELTGILEVTREASANPGLARSGVKTQIRELGAALKSVTGALNDQNARVRQLGIETARAKADVAKAVSKAEERARSAAGTRQRLEASAAAPERLSAPCELSPTLKDAWR